MSLKSFHIKIEIAALAWYDTKYLQWRIIKHPQQHRNITAITKTYQPALNLRLPSHKYELFTI